MLISTLLFLKLLRVWKTSPQTSWRLRVQGSVVWSCNVDCHSFLLTGLLHLQHDAGLQIRQCSSLSDTLKFQHWPSLISPALLVPLLLTHWEVGETQFFLSFTMHFFLYSPSFLPPTLHCPLSLQLGSSNLQPSSLLCSLLLLPW